MLWYIDPASYGKEDRTTGMEAPTVLRFYYDPTKSASERVQAERYNCTVDENGVITLGTRAQANVARNVINDRLSRLMDQLIIVGDVQDGHEYYKSKSGTPIRVQHMSDGRLCFSGGWQLEHQNLQLPVEDNEIYTKTNGKSYQLNTQMPLGAQKTVYMTLQEKEEFSEFLDLLDHDGAALLSTKLNNKYTAGMTDVGSKNLGLLDNYNYTVYVPTNASIRKLIDDGLLPTWEDYENQTEEIWRTEALADSARQVIKDIIVNFLRYHVQDHAIAVGMAPEDGSYTNAYESMKRNLETGRFYPIEVDFSGNQLTVKDANGDTHKVIKSDGLYNRICREYWYNGSGNTAEIFMASDAILHQIDGVLLYDKLTPWQEQLNKLREK
jgi:hypothetical protein